MCHCKDTSIPDSFRQKVDLRDSSLSRFVGIAARTSIYADTPVKILGLCDIPTK